MNCKTWRDKSIFYPNLKKNYLVKFEFLNYTNFNSISKYVILYFVEYDIVYKRMRILKTTLKIQMNW